MRQPKTLADTDWARQTWDATHGAYLTGRAHIDEAGKLQARLEAHWGCGRLRLLVGPELREKFDRQRYKLQAAIEAGGLEDVVREAQRMSNALTALDAGARAAGAQPLPVTVWEVALADGTVAAIVQDDGDAKDYLAGGGIATGRQVAVYTLDEIARMLDHHKEVVAAKLAFPGATVTRSARSIGDPLDRISHPGSLDDPMEHDSDGYLRV